jgi:signal transduction histidine kinase
MNSNSRAAEAIRERKNAEKSLSTPPGDASKMEAIGRLLGGVAHDFNNLLTGILLYCDLLLEGLENDDRLRRYAEEIRSASESGGALIQQLLTMTRSQPGEPSPLSLNSVISSMKNLLNRLLGENIRLDTDLTNDLGLVKIDSAQAQQIILNLVLNSRDAMPYGGPIKIASRNCHELANHTGQWIELSVTDAGLGMTPETQGRLFERYFTTKPVNHGNGLGLSTVQQIVHDCGGSIEIESAPGCGTHISIHFPRCPEECKPDVHRVSSSPSPRLPQTQFKRGIAS